MRMNPIDFHQLRQLRVEGKFEEATLVIASAIRGKQPSVEALAELTRLMLLMGKVSVAQRTYETLQKMSVPGDVLEPECAIRLSLMAGDKLLDGSGFKEARLSRWATDFINDGIDKRYPLRIQECSLAFNEQQCGIYELTCVCGSCDSEFITTISTSFLLYREFLCPLCLGRQLLDYDNLRQFVETEFRDLVEPGVSRMDYALKSAEMALEDSAFEGGDELALAEAYYHGSTILVNQVALKVFLGRDNEKLPE